MRGSRESYARRAARAWSCARRQDLRGRVGGDGLLGPITEAAVDPGSGDVIGDARSGGGVADQ